MENHLQPPFRAAQQKLLAARLLNWLMGINLFISGESCSYIRSIHTADIESMVFLAASHSKIGGMEAQ